jgi:hypothetical protein
MSKAKIINIIVHSTLGTLVTIAILALALHGCSIIDNGENWNQQIARFSSLDEGTLVKSKLNGRDVIITSNVRSLGGGEPGVWGKYAKADGSICEEYFRLKELDP